MCSTSCARLRPNLDRLEQQYGPHEELDDTRRRVEAVRARVLERLARAWPPPRHADGTALRVTTTMANEGME
jgi:hypothetical protein